MTVLGAVLAGGESRRFGSDKLAARLGDRTLLDHAIAWLTARTDAVVVCGRVPAIIPYVDPGFALAKAVQTELTHFRDLYGTLPKLLLLENHGPVAMGSSAREVMNIMLMADKWARTLAGTYALGGPKFLPDEEVARIDGRLDEHYRRGRLVES